MSPSRLAKLEFPVRIVLDFNEAFNRHDVAAMMQLVSDDCVFENTTPPPDGSRFAGKDEITRFWQDFFQRSPHARIEIEEIFGLGLRCVMRWRYEWVNEGGEKGHVRGVDLYQIKNGLISQKMSYVKG